MKTLVLILVLGFQTAAVAKKSATAELVRSEYMKICLEIPNVKKLDAKGSNNYCSCMAKQHLSKGLSQKELSSLHKLYTSNDDVIFPANADEDALFNFDLDAADLCIARL